MAILRTGFVALLLVCAANASQPLESARDQYKAHEDVPHPPQLLSEATDQPGDVHQPLHGVSTTTSESTETAHSNLQSPSAEHEHLVEQTGERPKTSSRQEVKGSRKAPRRRSIGHPQGNVLPNFNPWSPSYVSTYVEVPPLQSFSLWQPQVYQISRPYFIPIWGSPGRIPLFFPPQPLFPNPGYPADNPPRAYLPPNRGYLPPTNGQTPRPSSNGTTLMPTGNRFNDGPVWDSSPPQVDNSLTGTTTTVKPTRGTRRPGQATTYPPLVHNEGSGSGRNQLSVSTMRPSEQPPSLISATQRPQQALRPPSPAENVVSSAKQPSRCVWAIISCCSTASAEVSYSCFEQLGCTGAFWDTNPCESEFARAAIASVMNYYNKK